MSEFEFCFSPLAGVYSILFLSLFDFDATWKNNNNEEIFKIQIICKIKESLISYKILLHFGRFVVDIFTMSSASVMSVCVCVAGHHYAMGDFFTWIFCAVVIIAATFAIAAILPVRRRSRAAVAITLVVLPVDYFSFSDTNSNI